MSPSLLPNESSYAKDDYYNNHLPQVGDIAIFVRTSKRATAYHSKKHPQNTRWKYFCDRRQSFLKVQTVVILAPIRRQKNIIAKVTSKM